MPLGSAVCFRATLETPSPHYALKTTLYPETRTHNLYQWPFPRFTGFASRHTHTYNGFLSGTTRVSQYQKGKTNLDFTEARDSEWQWHQLGHMQVCTSLQTDNHASTPPLSFLQARCPSCHPTNSVKALKAVGSSVMPTISQEHFSSIVMNATKSENEA